MDLRKLDRFDWALIGLRAIEVFFVVATIGIVYLFIGHVYEVAENDAEVQRANIDAGKECVDRQDWDSAIAYLSPATKGPPNNLG